MATHGAHVALLAALLTRAAARLALVALAMAPLVPAVACAADPAIAIVVHPAREVTLSPEDVARIFLGMRRFWDDGAPIVVLNRETQSTVRGAFTRRVLHMDRARLQAYWNEQYFHGIFPPAVLSSAVAVRRYVAADRNAIGYLDASDVDDTVRVLLRLE